MAEPNGKLPYWGALATTTGNAQDGPAAEGEIVGPTATEAGAAAASGARCYTQHRASLADTRRSRACLPPNLP